MTAVSEVCALLKDNSIVENGLLLISYSQFAKSRWLCHEKYGDLYDMCFWPRVYVSFPFIDVKGVPFVETRCLMKYIHEFERTLQLSKELHALGKDGKLTAEDLSKFTTRKLKTFYALRASNRAHLAAACKLACIKFLFYHERNGYCKVEDVVLGTTAWELDKALRCLRDQTSDSVERNMNWFSDTVICNVAAAFLQLAGDCDGALTQTQFSSLPSFSTLSRSFTNCLFHSLAHNKDNTPFRNEPQGVMDLESYGIFVLAWHDRNSTRAVKYLFKLLDVNCVGYLTPKDLHDFAQDSVDGLAMNDPEGVYDMMAQDIVTELLDMITPSVPTRITAMDVLRSKNGYEVFGILADATELYRHEHRDD